MDRRGFLGLLLGGVAVLMAIGLPGAEAARRYVIHLADGGSSELKLAC
jgi:hypothetical protein